MGVSVTSSGFADLDRQLAKLMGGVPQEQQREILHEGAQIIADEAKRLAPFLTGTLRDSIMVTDDRDARVYGKLNAGISVYIGPVGSTEDGDVYYAKFQEFGTRYMQAHPFMRPAIAAKRPEAERLVMTRLAGAVLGMVR
jgi:HK97 gp10 family phage protein